MLMHLVLLEITGNTRLKPHGHISSSEMVGIMEGQLSKYLVQREVSCTSILYKYLVPFTFYLCIAEGYVVALLWGWDFWSPLVSNPASSFLSSI